MHNPPSSHLSPVPLPPLATTIVPIHRQPQAVPVGFDRQGHPSPSEVGPGVSGHPLLVGCLHEPPSRQDGGIRRWRVCWLPRRGSHPLQQRPLHQGRAVRWSPKDGRVNTHFLMCRIWVWDGLAMRGWWPRSEPGDPPRCRPLLPPPPIFRACSVPCVAVRG